MNFFRFIVQDQKRNNNNTKGKIATFCFRFANYCRDKKITRVFFFPYLAFYKFFFDWLVGMELPYDTAIGSGLKILHLQAIVINRHVIIGKNFTLRHSTTIGNKGEGGKCPVIGDNVTVGAHVCIIGPIKIGNNVTIGAGSVVIKNVPDNAVVVGNPARVVEQLNSVPAIVETIDKL